MFSIFSIILNTLFDCKREIDILIFHKSDTTMYNFLHCFNFLIFHLFTMIGFILENNQCCKMFVCSTWNKICRSSSHGSCNIVFNGAVPKEILEPNSLSISDPFFYILNFSGMIYFEILVIHFDNKFHFR